MTIFSGYFKGVSREFQGNFVGVSMVNHGCFKGFEGGFKVGLIGFQGYFDNISRVFHGFFKDVWGCISVSRVFPGCSNVFQRISKGVSILFQIKFKCVPIDY